MTGFGLSPTVIAAFTDGFAIANERCESIDRIVLLNLPPRDWRGEYLGRVPPEEAADVALDELASVAGIQPP